MKNTDDKGYVIGFDKWEEQLKRIAKEMMEHYDPETHMEYAYLESVARGTFEIHFSFAHLKKDVERMQKERKEKEESDAAAKVSGSKT